MKKYFLLSLLGLMLMCSKAQAASLVYNLDLFTDGDDADATIEIDDNTANLFRFHVQVTPHVPSGNIGDITGVFFDLSPLVALTNITMVTGASPTGFANNTNDLGGGVNLTGGGSNNPGLFDVGLKFPGFSFDDTQEIEFTIDRTDLDLVSLSLTDFGKVGLRLQSVGTINGAREGSSKMADLVGDYIPNPQGVPSSPEPATIFLLGSGLAGYAFRRRFAKK
jgi:hypothetical protein